LKTLIKYFSFPLLIFPLFNQIYPADSTRVTKICNGATLVEYYLDGPIAIKELILNLDSIRIGNQLARNYLGNGGEKTSEIFKRVFKNNHKLIAAVNADFFGGNPHRVLNSMVKNRRIVKGVNIGKSQFAVDQQGNPSIGIFRFKGNVFTADFSFIVKYFNSVKNKPSIFNFYFNKLFRKYSLSGGIIFKALKPVMVADTIPIVIERKFTSLFADTLNANELFLNLNNNEIRRNFRNYQKGDTLNFVASFDSLNTPFETLVGGRPRLILKGKALENFFGLEGLHSSWFIGKNPRTAIGFNKSRNKLFVIVVDGRQAGYSIGMSLPELSIFLRKEGAYEALNLDGGGSATIVVNGVIVNLPSDSAGERPVHNALLFFKKR